MYSLSRIGEFYSSHRPILIYLIVYFLFILILSTIGLSTRADSWRILNSAYYINTHHAYMVSRFPGYPVTEFFYSLFILGGVLFVDAIACFISVFALFIFHEILVEFKIENSLYIVIFVSQVSIWLKSSLYPTDYILSILLLLLSLFMLLKYHNDLSAIIFSLGVGSRPNNIYFGFFFLLFFIFYNKNYIKGIRFFLISFFVSILWLSPLVLTYGSNFLTIYPSNTWNIFHGIYQFFSTFSILFIIFVFCLSVLFLSLFVRSVLENYPQYFNVSYLRKIYKDNKFQLLIIFTIIPALIIYFYQPQWGEYLIPTIPLFFLAFGKFFKRNVLLLLIVMLVFSNFVPIYLNDPPVTREISNRISYNSEIQKILKYSFSSSSVLIDPYDEPTLLYYSTLNHPGNWQKGFQVIYIPDINQLKYWSNNNYTIYYIANQLTFIDSVGHYNLTSFNAIPF